jgi:hypothetical protein
MTCARVHLSTYGNIVSMLPNPTAKPDRRIDWVFFKNQSYSSNGNQEAIQHRMDLVAKERKHFLDYLADARKEVIGTWRTG